MSERSDYLHISSINNSESLGNTTEDEYELPEKIVSLLQPISTAEDPEMVGWLGSLAVKIPEYDLTFPLKRSEARKVLVDHYSLNRTAARKLDEEAVKFKWLPFVKKPNSGVKGELLLDEKGFMAYAALSKTLEKRYVTGRNILRIQGITDEVKDLLGEEAYEALFAKDEETETVLPVKPPLKKESIIFEKKKTEERVTKESRKRHFSESKEKSFYIPNLNYKIMQERLAQWTPQRINKIIQMLERSEISHHQVLSREVLATVEFVHHYLHKGEGAVNEYNPYIDPYKLDGSTVLDRLYSLSTLMVELQANNYQVESLRDVYEGFKKSALSEGITLEKMEENN